ncbi:MAG: hypothetical protein JJU12_07805 [Chlamydiales bacterium]|nr:hypothetical protein [Chlamydiales bacterium]
MPDGTPGVTPTPPTPEYGRDKPRLGEGEEAQEQKPFSFGPEGKEPAESAPAEKPSPMEVAREGAEKGVQRMTPDQMNKQLAELKNQLGTVQTNLQNPNVTRQFTQDHYDALQKAAEKTNPEMRAIAKHTGGEFNPPQHLSNEPVLNYITRWINGSQQTLSQAMNFVGTQKNPDPASFLKLQYSVQRATQRGELFSSIVGASVSGIKTIMSTQLG